MILKVKRNYIKLQGHTGNYCPKGHQLDLHGYPWWHWFSSTTATLVFCLVCGSYLSPPKGPLREGEVQNVNCSHFSCNCSHYGTISKHSIQSIIQSVPNASANLKSCQFCQKGQHSNSVLNTQNLHLLYATGATDVETWPILWPTNESWNVYNHKNTGSLWMWCFLLSQPPKCLMDVGLWHFLIFKACNLRSIQTVRSTGMKEQFVSHAICISVIQEKSEALIIKGLKSYLPVFLKQISNYSHILYFSI